MRVSRFMKPAVSEGKGTVLAHSEYRAGRRALAKERYRDAKRGLLSRPVEASVRSLPIRQNTKFDRWF